MHRETKLTHYGRGPLPGPANPPIERASTILHESVEALESTKLRRKFDDNVLSYGRRGTTTSHALSDALCDLEQGDACFLYPSGVAALASAIGAFVKTGDHVLVVDEAFHATRRYCEDHLRKMGIGVSYFPWDTRDLTPHVQDNTKVVVVESPTSHTFKVMDLPALCLSAERLGLTVIADNTYGSGWLYQPLNLGCDVSVISGSKYLSGHADTMMGAVVSRDEASSFIRRHTHLVGQVLGPDDAYACLRGIRTLGLRMERHATSSTKIARWLLERREVTRVWHPGLTAHPGHELWKRDASGVNGLLSISFNEMIDPRRFINNLSLFLVGASWGGFESLALLSQQPVGCSNLEWPQVRLHVGIENVVDLIGDLESALSEASSFAPEATSSAVRPVPKR